MPHHATEQRVAALLDQDPSIRQWLERKRALVKDGSGQTAVRGLAMDETEEFLRLHPLVQFADSGLSRADLAVAKERYLVLREKLDAALQDEAIEGLSSWSGA